MNRTPLALLLLVCGCASNPGPDAGDAAVADHAPAPDTTSLDTADGDSATRDAPRADEPVADVPTDSRSPEAGDVHADAPSDSGPTCVGGAAACVAAPDNCCLGYRCVSGVAGFTCVARTDCAAGGLDCGPAGMPCCPGLVCMVRGGPGGMVCASPMCRATGAPCDLAHPCCPASMCAGMPGDQRCLPTA